MTQDQEHLVTMLFVKYGGLEAVVDLWLHRDESLTADELVAINAWLADDQTVKSRNITLETDGGVQFVTMDFPLDDSEID